MIQKMITLNRRVVITVIVVLALIAVIAVATYKNYSRANAVANNREILAEYTQQPYEAVLDELKAQQEAFRLEALEKMKEEQNAQVTEDVSSAAADPQQWASVFEGCVFVGDSITEGFTAYNVLPNDEVASGVGASVGYSDDLFSKAAALHPSHLFVLMGLNDLLTYNADPDAFIEAYDGALEKFEAQSPDTKIHLCSVLPVQSQKTAENPIWGKGEVYNTALKEYCNENEGVDYIDTTVVVAEHPEYYAQDGYHFTSAFYPALLETIAYGAFSA